jgi:hypothetical protein
MEDGIDFSVLRFCGEIDQDTLSKECEELKKTRYQRAPRLEDAPDLTDCLTAIWHLVRNVFNIEFEVERIGNVPRHLVEKWKWEVKVVSLEDLISGDLIFLKGKDKERLITHVGIVIAKSSIFHSSREREGGFIEELPEMFKRYDPVEAPEVLLEYVDPREARVLKEEFPL